MHGAGKVPKKYSRKRKLKEKKIHARQLTLKNIHGMASKKNSYKEFDNKKNSCGSKIPHPPLPHNFSNGPSLSD